MANKEAKLPVKDWIGQYKEQFERYSSYCEANDWVKIGKSDLGVEYDAHKTIVRIILDRLKYFVSKFEPYLEYKYAKNFVSLIRTPVLLFLERCNTYIESNNWLSIKDKQTQIEEIEFQNKILTDINKVKDELQKLNLDDEVISLDLKIFSNKKLPLLMQETLEKKFPQIITFKETLKDIKKVEKPNISLTPYDVSTSSEMYINMKNPPEYDPTKHYFEQSDDVLQFYKEELNKIKNGVTIGGVFIHPWLYWHLNYFVTDIPMVMFEGKDFYDPSKERVIYHPFLRDNEIFLADSYRRAELENLGLFIFGTRRAGKALRDSTLVITKEGDRPISSLKVGDTIYGIDGKETKVLGVYPQGIRQLYRIYLKDGRTIDADGEHLWKVEGIGGNFEVLRTIDLLKNPTHYKIPNHNPIDYTDELEDITIDELSRNPKLNINYLKELKTCSIEQRQAFVLSLLGRSNSNKIEDEDTVFLEVLTDLFRSLGMLVLKESENRIYIPFNSPYLSSFEIEKIEEIDKDYATCIEVDNIYKLFLTSNFIVTHNTVIESSILSWRTTIVENSESLVIGGDKGDLAKLSRTLETAFTNVNAAFRLPRNFSSWDSLIQFGIKDKDGTRVPYSDIFIRNVNEGKSKASLKTAGATPTAWIVDEAGKFNCKKMYKQAIPSFQNPKGWNVVPVLTGCLTEGNYVYTKEGVVVDISKLKQEDGILGYSGESPLQENINWFKEPTEKDCVEIHTEQDVIRCSIDHPILCKKRGAKSIVKRADEVKAGDIFLILDSIEIFGNNNINTAFEKGESILTLYGYYKKTLSFLGSYDKSSLCNFIGGVFSVYGRINRKDLSFHISDTSLLRELKYYLLKLGIHSRVTENELLIFNKLDISRFEYNIPIFNGLKKICKLNNRIKNIKKPIEYPFIFRDDFPKGEYYKDKIFRGVRCDRVIETNNIGKAKVYNMNTSISHSYITGAYLSMNTGGDSTISKDAQEMLTNPVENKILPMDWNALENFVGDKNLVTWKRKDFGIFIPSQMSFKTGLVKKDSNLSEFLKVDSEELKKIEIKVTDWKNSLTVIKKERDSLKKKQSDLAEEKMGYPIDPMECFLMKLDNPFPAAEAQEHKDNLEREGNTGKIVEVYRKNGTSKLGYSFSEKSLAAFPFEGGNIDSPVLLFEDPPVDNTMDGTYVAGLDHYKHDKASTDSIGALYIFKRNVNLDEWSGRIVASYCSRPNSIDDFNRVVEMLLEGFGAECLQENADISFQQYLKNKQKDSLLLANGEEFARKFVNSKATQNNKYGLNPNPKNQQYLLNLVISYCHEDIEIGSNEEGEKIIVKGVTRINDLGLLDEIINYRYGGNFDRIIAFGHALAWGRYLDSLNIMPKLKRDVEDNTYRKQVRRDKLKFKSPYSSKKFSPY